MTSPRLREHLAQLFPGWVIRSIEPLSPDRGGDKAAGYGLPLRVRLVDERGSERSVVWRVMSANEFGHDRRADRAGNTLLAFDDFARIPRHIEALDVGAIDRDGTLTSLRDAGELYLLTSFAPGRVYADDLRRVGREGVATDLDVARVDALATYLAALHVPEQGAQRYRRAIRDLVGHGEGIFGIVDGYPDGLSERLQAIEARCVTWRWKLRAFEHRLVRTHGDFHPFNIVFADGTEFACLDASRGTCGDAADDLCALAVNFVLFASRDSWARGHGVLWHRLWTTYQKARPDPELLRVAPVYFAWRTLVVCNPTFYPNLDATTRGKLLDFATHHLDAGELDLAAADRLFA